MIQVVLIAALTADGYIARDRHELSTDWTSKEDTAFFRAKTKEIGTVIFGKNTFKTANKALSGRRTIVYSRTPVDVEGVETTSEDPQVLLARLEREGLTSVALCGGQAIYQLFFEADAVDELYLTIEPQLFGGGVRLWDAPHDKRLRLIESRPLNDQSILLHYQVEKDV